MADHDDQSHISERVADRPPHHQQTPRSPTYNNPCLDVSDDPGAEIAIANGSLGNIIADECPLKKLGEKKVFTEVASDQRDGDHGNIVFYTSKLDKIKHAFSCPPHGKVGEFITNLLLLFFTWGSLYSITGSLAAPGGTIFSLLVVFVCAVVGGKIAEVCRLPPLLGMLFVGIALRNVPVVNVVGDSLNPEWSATIRKIALTVILIRAGLGLDPQALKKMSLTVFVLAFVPCLVEASVVAVVTHYLLGFSWLWGLILGFVLSAVSPAVVVPCLLQLSQQGWGVAKGIPTLVIAAASLNGVLAISGFGVTLGINFSEGSLTGKIMQGPIEVLMGLAFGVFVGMLCWVLPNKNQKSCSVLQFGVLLMAGLFALFGSQKIKYGGAGAIAVLSMAFIAGMGFRKQSGGDNFKSVNEHGGSAWTLLQPMLFALIGTEIQLLSLELDTVGFGMATIGVCITARVVTTFFVVLGSGLNVRERLFVALAWLPKATVQAAIGSTALDYANRINAPEDQIMLGRQVLNIAVLSIVTLAPIGAIAIMTSAPRLLQNSTQDDTATPKTA